MAFSFQEALSYRTEHFLHAEACLDHVSGTQYGMNFDSSTDFKKLKTILHRSTYQGGHPRTLPFTSDYGGKKKYLRASLKCMGFLPSWIALFLTCCCFSFVSFYIYIYMEYWHLESMTWAFYKLFHPTPLSVSVNTQIYLRSGTNAQMPAGQWTFPRCCCLCSVWFPFILCRTSDPRWTFLKRLFIDQLMP